MPVRCHWVVERLTEPWGEGAEVGARLGADQQPRGRAAAGRRLEGARPAWTGRRDCALDEALSWTVGWYRAFAAGAVAAAITLDQIERYADLLADDA